MNASKNQGHHSSPGRDFQGPLEPGCLGPGSSQEFIRSKFSALRRRGGLTTGTRYSSFGSGRINLSETRTWGQIATRGTLTGLSYRSRGSTTNRTPSSRHLSRNARLAYTSAIVLLTVTLSRLGSVLRASAAAQSSASRSLAYETGWLYSPKWRTLVGKAGMRGKRRSWQRTSSSTAPKRSRNLGAGSRVIRNERTERACAANVVSSSDWSWAKGAPSPSTRRGDWAAAEDRGRSHPSASGAIGVKRWSSWSVNGGRGVGGGGTLRPARTRRNRIVGHIDIS